jgi:hypothetical protein
MTTDDSTPVEGGRRGRYALLAAIVALTAGGATAIGAGALRSEPAEPPIAAGVSAVPSQEVDRVPPAATGGRDVLGRDADGAMAVPGDATTVGWYTSAPTPGSLGPAILAGHVDFKSRPGTFAKLRTLKADDMITVERADGSVAMFAVTTVQRYAKDRFPSAAVYGAIDHAGLRLITCGGDFDTAKGHYEDNIVVYASLRHSHPA